MEGKLGEGDHLAQERTARALRDGGAWPRRGVRAATQDLGPGGRALGLVEGRHLDRGCGAPQVPQPNQAADGSVPITNRATYQWAGAGFGIADTAGLVAPSALENSGSGGGGNGDGYPQNVRMGGNGGSGIVLIAYPT